MSTDALPIFNAVLNLSDSLRADLAAHLIASLDATAPPLPRRSPSEWEATLLERSDAMHRGEATLVDGEEVLQRMRSAIDRIGERE